MLQEATFTCVSTNPTWRDPFTGGNNTPTIAWTFQEYSTVNPVVADLLCLRSLVNRQFNITPSVFYHPGTQNTISDYASRQFHLAPDIFLSLFSETYSPQKSPGVWNTCHPPSKIVSSVISALRKQPFEMGMSPVRILSRNIMTGCPSAPKCRWTIFLKTRRTPLLRSFKCLDTGSVTNTTPHKCPVSGRTRLLQCGVLSPRLTSWKADETLKIYLGRTVGKLTSASPACSATMVSVTPLPPKAWKGISLGFCDGGCRPSLTGCLRSVYGGFTRHCPLLFSPFLRVYQDQLPPPHNPIPISRHAVSWCQWCHPSRHCCKCVPGILSNYYVPGHSK